MTANTLNTVTPTKLAEEGKAAYQLGDYLAAARAYESAAEGCTMAGEALQAAEMANNSSVAYLQAGEAEAALRTVEGTAAVFAAAGDLRRQGMALGNLGAALEAVNRLEEAQEAYQQSADVLRQAGEMDLRVHVMQSLSALQLRTGKQLQALATMQAGLEGVERPNARQRLMKQFLKMPFKLLNK